MTLYSELGVKESSSGDEIRAAYLRQAKAQHPDHVQEEGERELADQKMSRLNHIMDVLGDMKKRAAYDKELASQRADADIRVQEALALEAMKAARHGRGAKGSRIRAVLFGAAGLAVLGIGSIIFLVSDFGEAPASHRTSETKSDPTAKADHRKPVPSVPTAGTASLPSTSEAEGKLPNASGSLDPSRRGKERVEPNPAALTNSAGTPRQLPMTPAADSHRESLLAEARRALAAPQAPLAPVQQAKDSTRPPANPAPVRVEPAREVSFEVGASPPMSSSSVAAKPLIPSFTPGPSPTPTTAPKTEPLRNWKGLWIYKADPRNDRDSQFKAVNVEMRLQEVNGRVHGTYKAIYSPNEAYLGDVDLLLSAMSFGDDWMRGVWSGNRGSYGQFELKKTPKGIEASWWTTRPGNSSSRASGSVLLTENHQ